MSILNRLREKNIERQAHWPGSDKVGVLFRSVEFAGEAGELCNAVKKLYRADNAIKGNSSKERAPLLENLIEEMGDVLITLDLLAMEYDVDLEKALVDKFNATSLKQDIDVLM